MLTVPLCLLSLVLFIGTGQLENILLSLTFDSFGLRGQTLLFPALLFVLDFGVVGEPAAFWVAADPDFEVAVSQSLQLHRRLSPIVQRPRSFPSVMSHSAVPPPVEGTTALKRASHM